MVYLIATADPDNTGKGWLGTLRGWSEQIDHLVQGNPRQEAFARMIFGRIFLKRDDLQAAQEELAQGLRIAEEQVQRPDRSLRSATLQARSDLALVSFLRLEEEAEADEAAIEAVVQQARAALVTARRELRSSDPEFLTILGNLAWIYCWQNNKEAAAPLAAEILALARETQDGSARLIVAEALAQQGLALKNQEGGLETAKARYLEALEIYQQLVEGPHPDVANAYNQLGLIAHDQGDLNTAAEQHAAALKIREFLYPEGDHWEIGQSQGHLASVRRDQGDLAQAEVHIREAIRIFQEDQDRGPGHGRTGLYQVALAEILLMKGDAAAAEKVVGEEISEDWWAARSARSRPRSWAEGVLGRALILQGRVEEGRPLLEGAARVLGAKPKSYERENAVLQGWLRDLKN